ncbi:hypothetical protein ACFQ9V_19110 [Leifsonia sp. NPDC056665]|uniref:hypothetical protein n=1 Tax=Leifsonia sp. NPDC056665 TaxID=3345901 RepID=UPI0036A347FE
MRVVEFSADAWQASAPGLQAGLAGRMEAVGQLAEGLESLAASGNITGRGADAMRAYIREVHVPILQSLLIGLSTFQTAVGVYWDGYAQVDAGGNFLLVKDEYDTHLAQLESGMETLRGFGTRLRQISADASHLVSLDGAAAKAAEQTANDLEGMHSIAKGQKETWEAYEASDPGFGQVQELIAQLRSIIGNVGALTIGRGRSYQAGSFTLTLQQLGELTTGMMEYCQENQKVAASGWETLFTQYAQDAEAAKREQAGWDLLWDGLQILAGAVITVIGVGLTPFTGGFSLGLTVLGGSLLVGGVNSAINHATIATTGNELNLIGMAAENVSHWYYATIATPAADSGVAGFQFLAGAGAAVGDLVAGGLQVNVKEIGDGIYTLATDQGARSELWNQLTTTVAKIVNGDAYTTGYATTTIVSLLVPGAAAAKFTRPGNPLSRASKLPNTAVKITTPNHATSALNLGKDMVGAGVTIVRRALTPTAQPFKDKIIPESLGTVDDLSMAMSKQIIATEKGSRPDPTTYLSSEYIQQHLSVFDEGATRFMTPTNLDKYGLGQRDGTAFVMPKSQVDALVQKTGGDPRAIERALGLPDGFFEADAVRVDIHISDSERLRIPSGNEAGANDQWIPGGKLPGGFSEGVIEVGELNSGRYSLSSMSQLEGAQ